MKITTRIGLVGFLLALSTINAPADQASAKQAATESNSQTIEGRLARIATTIRERENKAQDTTKEISDQILAGGWANGSGRGWVNGGGWRNGGGWLNGNNWHNGWRDGGSFYNYRY